MQHLTVELMVSHVQCVDLLAETRLDHARIRGLADAFELPFEGVDGLLELNAFELM